MYSITNNPYKTNQCWHQTIQIQMNHSVYQATSHTGSPEPQSLRKFIMYAGFKFCIMWKENKIEIYSIDGHSPCS